jgi:hypothetical protein
MEEYNRYYQIDITQYPNYDRHCKCRIHGLRILGRKIIKDEEQSSVPTVIVSDSPEVKEKNLGRQEQQHIAGRRQAGGVRRWWGRVFKKRDQEGGHKSSKTMSQVCVSGGGGGDYKVIAISDSL